MAQVKTAAEMFPLVERWQKSGLTQKEFSQQHGVSEHVFYYWVSRYRNALSIAPLSNSGPVAHSKPVANTETAAGFIRLSSPVEAVPPAARGEAQATTVVELPSGVVLRFRGLVPVAYLKELLTGSLV